jgi:hypothetical protein
MCGARVPARDTVLVRRMAEAADVDPDGVRARGRPSAAEPRGSVTACGGGAEPGTCGHRLEGRGTTQAAAPLACCVNADLSAALRAPAPR